MVLACHQSGEQLWSNFNFCYILNKGEKRLRLHTAKGQVAYQAGTYSQGGGHCHYMGYIGMHCCEGYGFKAVYSTIGYLNQSIWV